MVNVVNDQIAGNFLHNADVALQIDGKKFHRAIVFIARKPNLIAVGGPCQARKVRPSFGLQDLMTLEVDNYNLSICVYVTGIIEESNAIPARREPGMIDGSPLRDHLAGRKFHVVDSSGLGC
ncbi:MAG TPA: hypothetical protein VKV39_07945 [Candidatus Sulfotelmatobacter sp.]|nr:hypothetical protein [Candidatus Sulfotelmatobacter sp.]